MESEERRAIFARRRKQGLLVGALLAFMFGGWPGLFAALLFMAVMRALEAWRREHLKIE